MPGYKSVLKSLQVCKAGRKRKCFHCSKKKISKGELVLVVKEGMKKSGYCSKCARKMLAKAQKQLDELAENYDEA